MVEDLRVLREGELAQRLDVSKRTLQNWRAQRPTRGPKFIKVGAAVRYPVASLEAWLRDQGR